MKILCIHGISHIEKSPTWKEEWTTPISQIIGEDFPGTPVEFEFFEYDDIFKAAPIGPAQYTGAVLKLLGSLAFHGIGDIFGRQRGLPELSDTLRWTVGMVAQWAESENLREKLMTALVAKINAVQPDVVMAHSLGTLVAYDTFSEKKYADLLSDRVLVTMGS